MLPAYIKNKLKGLDLKKNGFNAKYINTKSSIDKFTAAPLKK